MPMIVKPRLSQITVIVTIVSIKLCKKDICIGIKMQL